MILPFDAFEDSSASKLTPGQFFWAGGNWHLAVEPYPLVGQPPCLAIVLTGPDTGTLISPIGDCLIIAAGYEVRALIDYKSSTGPNGFKAAALMIGLDRSICGYRPSGAPVHYKLDGMKAMTTAHPKNVFPNWDAVLVDPSGRAISSGPLFTVVATK